MELNSGGQKHYPKDDTWQFRARQQVGLVVELIGVIAALLVSILKHTSLIFFSFGVFSLQ